MKDLAIKASQEAGKILRDNFGKVKKIMVKNGKELVSNVDLEAEKKIIKMIREKYPDHDILCEEQEVVNKGSQYRWIIDPLDGTHNYIRNIDIFGVSIALEYENEVILGIIYLPMSGELYLAQKGKGAYLNNQRIKVSQRNLNETSMIYDSTIHLHKEFMFSFLDKLVNRVFNVRMFGSSARSLSFIAAGKMDLQIECHDKPWDFAAGALMVEEAGGKVTDLYGNSWSPYSKQYIASNGRIHEEVLRLLSTEKNFR